MPTQCFLVTPTLDAMLWLRIYASKPCPGAPGPYSIHDNWTRIGVIPSGVILPNGHEWNVDSRASNCTMKEDRLHRCWVRHGEPPLVTANKQGGRTCAAGAGSIAVPGYHGFLNNGVLT